MLSAVWLTCVPLCIAVDVHHAPTVVLGRLGHQDSLRPNVQHRATQVRPVQGGSPVPGSSVLPGRGKLAHFARVRMHTHIPIHLHQRSQALGNWCSCCLCVRMCVSLPLSFVAPRRHGGGPGGYGQALQRHGAVSPALRPGCAAAHGRDKAPARVDIQVSIGCSRPSCSLTGTAFSNSRQTPVLHNHEPRVGLHIPHWCQKLGPGKGHDFTRA